MTTQAEKAARFHALHQQCFIIPNPWDQGSARLLETMGFQALASTSAGFAWSCARPDLGVRREAIMAYLGGLCAATDLPVSADLQNGFGASPQQVYDTIIEAAGKGVVGASIEDMSDDPDAPLFDIGLAKERIQAAAEAARSLPFKFTLTARAENYFIGRHDLDDTIARLQAYQEAGADVLFAPGLSAAADIGQVCASVDRPVNVVMGPQALPLDAPRLAALGVKRISVGGALARVAYDAVMRAGREMLASGTFQFTRTELSSKELNTRFGGH